MSESYQLSTFVHTKDKVEMHEASLKRGKSVRAEDRAAYDFLRENHYHKSREVFGSLFVLTVALLLRQ